MNLKVSFEMWYYRYSQTDLQLGHFGPTENHWLNQLLLTTQYIFNLFIKHDGILLLHKFSENYPSRFGPYYYRFESFNKCSVKLGKFSNSS